jgi:hypothetical protein
MVNGSYEYLTVARLTLCSNRRLATTKTTLSSLCSANARCEMREAMARLAMPDLNNSNHRHYFLSFLTIILSINQKPNGCK